MWRNLITQPNFEISPQGRNEIYIHLSIPRLALGMIKLRLGLDDNIPMDGKIMNDQKLFVTKTTQTLH